MTAQEIVEAAIGSGKELTPVRIAKVKALCQRMNVSLDRVVMLLPPEEQVKFSA